MRPIREVRALLSRHPRLVHGDEILPEDLSRSGLWYRVEELDPAGQLLEFGRVGRHEGTDLLRSGLARLHRGLEDDVGPRRLASPAKEGSRVWPGFSPTY